MEQTPQEKHVTPLRYLPLRDYGQQERAQKIVDDRNDEENYFIDSDPLNGLVLCVPDTKEGGAAILWVKGNDE